MLQNLDNCTENYFPNISEVEDGYIAYGGELTPTRLIAAYSIGAFPFYRFRTDPILWACPLERYVIFPDEIHVSHSMRNIFNSGRFEVTFNKNFKGVIKGCATIDNRYEETDAWLGKEMIKAYTHLHEMGIAKSVEVWGKGELVGGLYGISLHNCFFGEAMFSAVPNASKIALISLARRMRDEGHKMIDCQLETSHLKSMGGRHISYQEYIDIVNKP